jgi:hypothetical protein
MLLPLAAAIALLAAAVLWLARRERALAAALAAVQARVDELTARLDGTDQDVARALTQAEMAEELLVEKGVVDEEDLEAMRQRFGPERDYVRERDGELN